MLEISIKVNKFNTIKNKSIKINIIFEIIDDEKIKIKIRKINRKNKVQLIFNIDKFIDIIKKDPFFLLKEFCNQNFMILISIRNDINYDILFNYFLEILDNQDIKEYYKLLYV